jgi:hypothetical protein|tara:strand:- start:7070 stop:7252 length:183 start_codon:yes stop_codon:yes gene_type:complete
MKQTIISLDGLFEIVFPTPQQIAIPLKELARCQVELAVIIGDCAGHQSKHFWQLCFSRNP